MTSDPRVVSYERIIDAPAERVFALIADPAAQPSWDGNDDLRTAADGQRIRGVGDVFVTTLTIGAVRENHVVEFEEGRRIAWRPAEPGSPPPGHLWRWELTSPVGPPPLVPPPLRRARAARPAPPRARPGDDGRPARGVGGPAGRARHGGQPDPACPPDGPLTVPS